MMRSECCSNTFGMSGWSSVSCVYNLETISVRGSTRGWIKRLMWRAFQANRGVIADFLVRLLQFFRKFHYAYLEINPTVLVDGKVTLDVAAKIDQTAGYTC